MKMNHSIFVLVAVFAGACLGQTPDTSTLRGSVRDSAGQMIGQAQIRLSSAMSGVVRSSESDDDGKFSFAGLPAEAYVLEVAKSGFASAKSGEIHFAGGTSGSVDMVLDVAPQKVSIVVRGTADSVRTDQPQLGQYVSGLQAMEIPLPNRRASYLPLLNAANKPAINQGDVFMNQNLFTTNGAGRRQTWFEVDGATDNDAWGRQTLFTAVPLGGIQELSILENAFSAEYGGSTGTVLNIVTRSGGNAFHGEALGDWRPAAPEAALSGFTSTNAASGNDVTSDKMGQGALALSGPFGSSSKSHFSVAGEYTSQNRASPVTSPIAPGSYVGLYRGWLGLARFDHSINDRNQLFFKSSTDGFRDTNPNGIVGGNSLPTVARIFKRRTFSEEAGWTATLSPSIVNTLRLQFQLASPITEFDPVVNGTQFSVPISTGGTFTSGTSQSASLQNRQGQGAETLSWISGRNQIKIGGDVIRARSGGNSKEFGGPIYLGQFVYKTCTLALSICESAAYLGNINNVATYTQSYGAANYVVNDTLWSTFVQDDFHATRNLTLNGGLRYERQTFTDSKKNFAPRVGFAYDLSGEGRTVLRGGFGIYYSQIVDNSAANYALTGVNGVFNYTAAPGQVGFPALVAAAPLPAFPAGAIAPVRSLYLRPGNTLFPAGSLVGFQNELLSPYSEQWTFGFERQIYHDWVLDVNYIGSHTLRINRPLDVDAPAPFVRTAAGQTRSAQAANCTRPFWVAFYKQQGTACNTAAATNPQPPYSTITSDVNNGYAFYDALDVNLTHRFSNHLSMLASYTWSHAIDNVDPDIPGQNPNDPSFTGKVENGNAIYDQRQRFVLSGVWVAPWKVHIGGVATLATGLPYNITTGTTNSGDTGATADRPPAAEASERKETL